VNTTPICSASFKNEWSYTSTSLYAYMACIRMISPFMLVESMLHLLSQWLDYSTDNLLTSVAWLIAMLTLFAFLLIIFLPYDLSPFRKP
jgi:hypothetical protein